MNAIVSFTSSLNEEDSFELVQLGNLVESDCDLAVQIQRQDSAAGAKDGGLAIGLAIAGLSVGAVGALISVLAFWRSTRPRYSVSMARGDTTFSIDNLHSGRFERMISNDDSDIEILISRE